MAEWIRHALDGDYSYFKELKETEQLDECIDQFGMTPLMYAILGRGYNDSSIIAEFRTFSGIGHKNCIGHTAYDILRCIADENIQKKNISLLMPLTRSLTKAGGMLGAIGASTAAIAGTMLFAALTKSSPEEMRKSSSSMSSTLSDLNGYAFSSDGSVERLKEYQAKAKEKILSIYEQIDSIEREYDKIKCDKITPESVRAEVLTLWENTVIHNRIADYYNERTLARNQINSSVQKDEFETSAEFNKRVNDLFTKKYGVEKSRDELSKLNDTDMLEISRKVEEIVDERTNEQTLKLQKLLAEKERLKRQTELVKIYAFTSGASVVLGDYDADTETFNVVSGRFKFSLCVPRRIARLMREHVKECKVHFTWKDDIDDNWVQARVEFRNNEYVTEKCTKLLLPLICESPQ